MPLSRRFSRHSSVSRATRSSTAARTSARPTSDPSLKVHFDKKPFWPALDQVLDQAGLTVYPFGEAGGDQRRGHARQQAGGPRGPRLLQRAVPLRADRRRRLGATARRRRRAVGGRGNGLGAAAADITSCSAMADCAAVDERGRPLPVADGQAQLEIPVGGEPRP